MNVSPSTTSNDTMNNIPKDQTISIGKQRINVCTFTEKVLEDISFLRDRIERAKELHSTESDIYTTYQKMLASRESVLKWFNDHNLIDTEDYSKHTH